MLVDANTIMGGAWLEGKVYLSNHTYFAVKRLDGHIIDLDRRADITDLVTGKGRVFSEQKDDHGHLIIEGTVFEGYGATPEDWHEWFATGPERKR